MSRLVGVGVAVLMVVGNSVRGDDKALPKGAPPRVVSVLKVDAVAGVIEYRERFPGLVLPEKDGPVKPGDAALPAITLPGFVTVKFPLKTGTVYDAAGKKVEPEEAAKRLAAGDIVLVSGDYGPVDPVYMKVFTKEVLILVHPAPRPGPPLPRLNPAKKDK